MKLRVELERPVLKHGILKDDEDDRFKHYDCRTNALRQL
jgi:hypothetical protein